MKDAPIRHTLEYAVYRLAAGAIQLLSPAGARRVGARLGDLIRVGLPKRRRIALRNLELALPEAAERDRRRIARGAFRTMGAAVCDAIASRRLDEVEFCRRLSLENWSELARAESRGRGVIVISAHIGFWEIAAQAIGLYRGTFHVVGRPLDNPLLQHELEPIRKRFGNEMLPKRGAARATMKVLKERGRVGVVIDQRVRPDEGAMIPFFGRPARSSPLASQLSLRFDAPIVPVFAYPEPHGRYRVAVREILEPPSSADEVPDHARRCLEVIEREIRRRPELWLWMHDRWKQD